jgi:hypothetical protein
MIEGSIMRLLVKDACDFERSTCGKITGCMETEPNLMSSSPPKMIASFATGFNAVANHIQIILIPILFDLFLWFGLHLRIKELAGPGLTWLSANLPSLVAPEMTDMAKAALEGWKNFFDHLNLFSFFRTYPVGVPSLMVSQVPLTNPTGNSQIMELSSPLTLAVVWLGLSLIGLVIGCLYFDMVARSTSDHENKFSLKNFGFETGQILFFSILLIVFFTVLAIFFMILVFIIALVFQLLAQLLAQYFPLLADLTPFLSLAIFWMLILFLFWLLLPFVFTPLAIFSYQQNILNSFLTSARLVRFFLPGTGLFLVLVFLIDKVSDLLWQIPPETSWMVLVGIAGHAFVSTGLLASSFVYFQGGMQRMQESAKKSELVANIL